MEGLKEALYKEEQKIKQALESIGYKFVRFEIDANLLMNDQTRVIIHADAGTETIV